jgi:hypothetical protein
LLDIQTVKDLVPRHQKQFITEELVAKLNELDKDPLLVGSFKENFIGYIDVIKTGKYSLEDYKNAVLFVSYKLLGSTDIDTYAKVFPDRYKKLQEAGLNRDQMSPYVSAYKKNKLVQKLIEQTLVPSYIINAPVRQEMINELVGIATRGRSEMARVAAASKVIDITTIPETAKIQLDIGVNDNYTDSIDELRKATEELALAQLQSIKAGKAVKEVAEMQIIEAELDG